MDVLNWNAYSFQTVTGPRWVGDSANERYDTVKAYHHTTALTLQTMPKTATSILAEAFKLSKATAGVVGAQKTRRGSGTTYAHGHHTFQRMK